MSRRYRSRNFFYVLCTIFYNVYKPSALLLGWTNYPADAERGIFINPAIVTVINHASSTNDQKEEEKGRELGDRTTHIEDGKMTGTAESKMTAETRGNGPNKLRTSKLGVNKLVLYSTGLIVDVPKPDFSMPFNALCLACTAVAILFGNIHSVCTKSVEIASDSNEKFIVKLGKKLKAKIWSNKQESKIEKEIAEKHKLLAEHTDTN